MKFISQILISAATVLLASFLLPGVHIDGMLTALIVALVLAFLNAVVKPIMIIFTIPITLFTLGLFLIFINGFIILLAAKIVDGFEIATFWTALWFSLIMSIINSFFERIRKIEESKKHKDNEHIY